MEADRLQQMLGEPLQVRHIQGAGRLQLHVLHCEPARPVKRNSQALSYAYVLVPVLEDTAPIRITRIPSGGWLALEDATASGAARRLLEKFGYPVLEATQVFKIDDTNGEASVAIELKFANGRITIDANPDGDPSSQSAYTAYLGTGDGYVSAYFGEEVSDRSPASVSVRFEGQTPLSKFGLRSTPLSATLDRRLVSDRIYWRVPTG